MINHTVLRVTTAALGAVLVVVGLVESRASFPLTTTPTVTAPLATTVGFVLIGVVVAELWLDRVRRHPGRRTTAPFVTGAILVVAGAIVSLIETGSRAASFGWTAYAPLSNLTYTPSISPGILLATASIGAMVVGAVLVFAAYIARAIARSRADGT